MKFFKSFLSILSNIGVDPKTSHMHQKEVLLSNKITLILLLMAIIGIVKSYFGEVHFTRIGLTLFISFLLCVFPLNKFGKSIIARFGLSVLPQFFLLLPNVISGIEKAENYLAFSYTFIGFTIIPLLLFHYKKDRIIFITALTINLMVIVFYDVLLAWSEKSEIDIQLLENNYIYYKLPQIIIWLIVVGSIQFLKKENFHNEERLKKSDISMMEFKNTIQSQNEEIVTQNKSINEKQLKIENQAGKLDRSINELENTKLELLKTFEKLGEAKDKLSQKEAEVESIFNAMNEHYLIAQYDLSGNLISINTRVIELLAVVRNDLFRNIKPIINKTKYKKDKKLSRNNKLAWEKLIAGEPYNIELDFNIGKETKYLATTLAPLFDSNNKPLKILAIGQDITELVEKKERINKINKELKEKISEISQQNELLNFQQKEIFDKSEELMGQNELLNFQQKEIFDKSEELKQQNELLNFQQKEIFDKSEKLIQQKEEIQTINETLELRIKERTKVLEAKNRQLTEYAFINSHILRSPVSTIMGLINLISYSTLPAEDQKIYEHIKETALKLDDVVIKINNAIDSRMHFSRDFFNHKP